MMDAHSLHHTLLRKLVQAHRQAHKQALITRETCLALLPGFQMPCQGQLLQGPNQV